MVGCSVKVLKTLLKLTCPGCSCEVISRIVSGDTGGTEQLALIFSKFFPYLIYPIYLLYPIIIFPPVSPIIGLCLLVSQACPPRFIVRRTAVGHCWVAWGVVGILGYSGIGPFVFHIFVFFCIEYFSY